MPTDILFEPGPVQAPVGHDEPVVAARRVVLGDAFATPLHHHPRGQLVGCTHGVLSISTETGSWIVPAGHAIWLPPDVPHGGRSHGPGIGWSLYVAPAACMTLPDTPRTVLVPSLLREAVLRCATWDERTPPDPAQARIVDVILDEIAALPAQAFDLPMPRDPRLLRIAQALLSAPADDRGLAAWASWVGSTPRTLTRRFPLETGYSFTAWRQRARLMRALERLADGQAVTTVALDLGYGSISAFISLFRRTFGATPSVYARSAHASMRF